MLKQISRLFREQFEKKLLNKKDKVDYSAKHDRSRYCYCKLTKGGLNVKPLNKTRNYEPCTEDVETEHKEEKRNDECRTSYYLNYNSILEALGLSTTFALAISLNRHFHTRERKLLNDLGDSNPRRDYCVFKKVLYSRCLWRNFSPKRVVLTQPPALNEASNTFMQNFYEEEGKLPVYGPQTAEEALNEASQGVKNAHNLAVGELENRLGLRYMSKKRYKKAVVHFSAGMALENGSAAYNLAQCYELGLGTSQDFSMAAKCYHRASDLGNAAAMYNLAVFYVHGWGGLKCDRHKAEELMRKAAALGEPNAKALCESYMKKSTPPVSPEINDKTLELKCKKEIQEVVESLMKSTLDVYQLSHSRLDEICSDNSTSTCSSVSRNSVLFSEIDHSDSSASYYSGICYENGIGVKQDFYHAINMYSRAAYNGSSPALYNLAACYETTAGVNGSDGYHIPLLMDLYRMAADRGHQYATERLKTLEIYELFGTLNDYLIHSKTTNDGGLPRADSI